MVFGGAPIGGLYLPVRDDQAAAALEAAWAAGIRAFDTAPHYGAGLSEQRLGRFLAGRPRDEFVLSTKVGRRLVPATGDVEGAEGFYGTPKLARVRDYSRDGTLAALEGSLRRLGTDRVDIALIHDPDDHAEQALDGAYAALDQLRSEGTIRAVGVGMNQAPLLEWFVERTDLDCVLVAGRYSLLDTAAAAACSRPASGVASRCSPQASSTAGYWPPPAPVRRTTTRPRPSACWTEPSASAPCAHVMACRSAPPPSSSFSATQPSRPSWSARAMRQRSSRT